MNAYFFSPVAYVVIVVFLVVSGYFFQKMLFLTNEATLRYSLAISQFVLSILTPVITMRLLSEETKTGTMETLMTAPVTDFEVVFGKFLAAWGLYGVMLTPTLLYIAALSWVGNPDIGPIISSYIGLILMGAMFVSVGLLVSALTKNQIVSAVIGIGALMILWFAGYYVAGGEGWSSEILRYIGTFGHWDTFTKGLIDTRDIIYYASLTALFIFITVRVVESRKWR
jgi:ABC-2 type transport system permease protein